MVSFDTKTYSKKLLHLISWSHWFTFFNIIAAIGLSSFYLFSEVAPDTLLGKVYLITTWVSHIAFLTFMSFVLILFPLTIIWPNTKVIRTSGSIIFTFGLLLLLLDGFIYSRLGYHLNASSSTQIFSLIKEIAQESAVFYSVSGMFAILILGFEFTISNYAWKHLKQLQKTVFARFVVFALVLSFFFSHLTHIWADANLDYDILRQDTVLPLSYPATAQTLLTKYGLFDVEDYIDRKTSPLSFSSAIPTYPTIANEACIKNEINQSVFLVLTDEQLSEKQLKRFTSRTNGSTYQLNNHVDSALLDNAWFNLFYSLPNIYQQDILRQSIKPLLFQAIEQQNLVSSFTLIDEAIEEDNPEPWFISLFNEKNYLNDISTLIFADKLNNKKAGIHLIYFKSGVKNNKSAYQFELFIEALLLAQQHKKQKDLIWISSIGNQTNDTQLSTKSSLLITPNSNLEAKSTETISKLTSHMDLQPTLMKAWLGCALDDTNYSNGSNLITLNKDRVIANTSSEGLMVFNKDKSVLIDQNGNFQSYSSQLDAPITVNKDFPLMIDGVHFIKRFSLQAEQKRK
jgi:membrane-anchored protein YejM (alkaline phosphatase superfamily)